MSPALRALLLMTDLGFLAYWAVMGVHAAGILTLPPDWLYPNADDARVAAWNWSFLPLDVAFSLIGLAATSAARRGDPIWRPLALISLVLTMTAGLMAVSYWTLTREIAWSWWLANLFLLVWPIPFLRGLVRELSRGA